MHYQHASSEDPDTPKESYAPGEQAERGLGITSPVQAGLSGVRRVPVGSQKSMDRVTVSSEYSSPESLSGTISQATMYQNTPQQERGGNKSADWTVSEDGW